MQTEYDSWGADPPSQAWCDQKQTSNEVAFLEKALQLTPGSSILDLFCSWGRHAIPLAIQGYNVLGLDISQPLISRARDTALRSNCSANFMVCDFWRTEFRLEFDVIYSIQSSPFEAWRSPREIVDFLKRVELSLKANGLYLFGWANSWNRSDIAEPRWHRLLKEKGIRDYEQTDLPFSFYGIREQTSLVEEAGLSVVQASNSYEYGMPYVEENPGLILIVKTR